MDIKNDVFAVRELHIRSQYLPVCVELPVSIRTRSQYLSCSELVDDQRNQRAIEPDAEHARRHASGDSGENESGGEGVVGHASGKAAVGGVNAAV